MIRCRPVVLGSRRWNSGRPFRAGREVEIPGPMRPRLLLSGKLGINFHKKWTADRGICRARCRWRAWLYLMQTLRHFGAVNRTGLTEHTRDAGSTFIGKKSHLGTKTQTFSFSRTTPARVAMGMPSRMRRRDSWLSPCYSANGCVGAVAWCRCLGVRRRPGKCKCSGSFILPLNGTGWRRALVTRDRSRTQIWPTSRSVGGTSGVSWLREIILNAGTNANNTTCHWRLCFCEVEA